MWWAIVTLATVGYGDVSPITPLGKVLTALYILASLIIIALPVGIVATAFASEIHRRDFVVTWSMVARVPLFAGLSAADIADISRLLRAQTVEAGTMIVRRGESGDSMYFIGNGEVEVELPGRAGPAWRRRFLRRGSGARPRASHGDGDGRHAHESPHSRCAGSRGADGAREADR